MTFEQFQAFQEEIQMAVGKAYTGKRADYLWKKMRNLDGYLVQGTAEQLAKHATSRLPTLGEILDVFHQLTARKGMAGPIDDGPPGLPRDESAHILKQLRRSRGPHWEPKVKERAGAFWFSQILHCFHEKTVQTTPIPPEALRALNQFGGQEALALVDSDTVMLARKTFAQLYAKEAGAEV